MNLHAKTSIRDTIAANRARLCVYATRQRTKVERMQTMRIMMNTVHLQCNIERFQKIMYKWIMDSGVTKYITSHRVIFVTCR